MRKESLTYKFLTWFERAIIAGLIFLMAVTVLFSALDLGWLVVQELLAPPSFLVDVNDLLDTFPHHPLGRLLPVPAGLLGGVPAERRARARPRQPRAAEVGPQPAPVEPVCIR